LLNQRLLNPDCLPALVAFRLACPGKRSPRSSKSRGWTAIIAVEQGKLLLTANDNIVTEVTFITDIKPGSDLTAAADLVIKNYGQPDRASMRDVAGQVTLDRAAVNYVNLVYGRKRRVEFSLSGRELWKYQVSVQFEHYRWHQNKTLRCAREKEQQNSAAREAGASEQTKPQ
jgi:hypothetical protein